MQLLPSNALFNINPSPIQFYSIETLLYCFIQNQKERESVTSTSSCEIKDKDNWVLCSDVDDISSPKEEDYNCSDKKTLFEATNSMFPQRETGACVNYSKLKSERDFFNFDLKYPVLINKKKTVFEHNKPKLSRRRCSKLLFDYQHI